MLLQNFHSILRSAAQGLRTIRPSELEEKPGLDRWSKKEIIGHLIDSAYNNHQRFLRGTTQTDLRFVGYDQQQWVARNAYQERPTEDVIATFFSVQHHLAHVIATIPEDILGRQTSEHDFHNMAMRQVPAGSPRSLGFLIEDYLYHLVHHLKQVIPGFTAEWYSGYQREGGTHRLAP